jgi:protein-disulfide isomerase
LGRPVSPTPSVLVHLRLFASSCTALLLAACSRDPSPAAVERVLVAHPEVLAAAIKAHPTEFMEAVNGALQVAQAAQQQAARDKLEEEFRNPKQPDLSGRVSLGNPAAPVTIVEYTDFECPYCRREVAVLHQVMQTYQGRVRLVVKQTPLGIHPNAMPAALMFEAIALQDGAKAFRFYELMYTEQARLEAEGQSFVAEAARRVGADVGRALRDQQSEAVRARVAADEAEGQEFGFTGTPGFLINGVALEGAHPFDAFARIIDRHLGAPPAAN